MGIELKNQTLYYSEEQNDQFESWHYIIEAGKHKISQIQFVNSGMTLRVMHKTQLKSMTDLEAYELEEANNELTRRLVKLIFEVNSVQVRDSFFDEV